ncbi:MAG: SusC/RagA family TonB-linked outer membrane protein [Ekhidna sp.]
MTKTIFKNTENQSSGRQTFCFSVILIFFATISYAQTPISGKIVDDSGETLPGVTVRIKGTQKGTITDIDGFFKIPNTSPDDVLLVSYIGMRTQTIPIKNQITFSIIMESDITSLNEIIVVGYGTQEKKDVTGAVSLIKDTDMKLRPNNQFGSLIQGKAAGVQVLSSSGKPSQGINLRIRGTNSINAGSEPLYVVDGVPTGDTRSINPSDIESITILKDASSAAIYGSQGSNGVVLITTKMGTSSKTSISLDTYIGFSEVWNTLSVLDDRDYRILMTELGQNTDWNQYTENTDWQDKVFQRGFTQNYQLSISGKNESTSYYISGGWVEQNGAVRSSRMDRSNFKINLDHTASKWLKVGSRIAYTVYSDVDVTDNQNVNQGGVLLGALSTPPNIGVFNDDGTFTSNPFQNWENPIASTDGIIREYRNQRLIGNAYTEATLFEGLIFKSNIGVDHSNGIFDSFLDPFLTSFGRALNGRSISNSDKSSYYIWDNTIRFQKEVGKGNFNALAGFVMQKWEWENSGITTQNFAGNGIQTPNAGSDIINATASKSEKANQSFISRINYEYDGRYLLTVNFRADGSSVFGPENRWGYFPSFSTGWRISDEGFFSDIDKVSELKLRAGWGIVGNDQIGNNYAYLGLVGGGANYPIGGVTQPGTFPASISNNTLKWEETQQSNIGIDVGFLNNRIGLTIDAYLKETNDLLLNAPLPRITGFDNAIQNIGSLRNKGIEISLNTVNIDKQVFWSSNINFSVNRNEVVDLVGQELFVGAIAGRGEASLVREGLPLGTLYGYQFGGVDPETGDAFYIDQNGESTFDPTADDRVIIGDSNPDFIYGFTNNLNYKNFSLTVFFQGNYGGDILNASRIDIEGMTDPKNQSTAVLDRWQQPGDNTSTPRASWGNTDNSRISTRFIEDGSYLRLKTLTVGYEIPNQLVSKIGLTSFKIYVTGENLLTFTSYSGFDPEVNAFGPSNTAQGIDYGTYPQTRSFIAGLNITF